MLFTEANTVVTATIHNMSKHAIIMDGVHGQQTLPSYWQSLGIQMAKLHHLEQPLLPDLVKRQIYGDLGTLWVIQIESICERLTERITI